MDSYFGEVPENNYINFTFKGGAADDTRRIRRIRLIAMVLERLGFEMEIHGDMIRGRFRKRPAAEIEERLDLLGRLMAYVRQMDMLMSDDSISQTLARTVPGRPLRAARAGGEAARARVWRPSTVSICGRGGAFTAPPARIGCLPHQCRTLSDFWAYLSFKGIIWLNRTPRFYPNY